HYVELGALRPGSVAFSREFQQVRFEWLAAVEFTVTYPCQSRAAFSQWAVTRHHFAVARHHRRPPIGLMSRYRWGAAAKTPGSCRSAGSFQQSACNERVHLTAPQTLRAADQQLLAHGFDAKSDYLGAMQERYSIHSLGSSSMTCIRPSSHSRLPLDGPS